MFCLRACLAVPLFSACLAHAAPICKPGQPVERTCEYARRFRQAYLDHAA